MSVAAFMYGLMGCVAAAGVGFCAFIARLEYMGRTRRRKAALGIEVDQRDGKKRARNLSWDALVLGYAERLGRGLYTGAVIPLSPGVRKGAAGQTRLGKQYVRLAKRSGCSKDVTAAAYCETCNRLTAIGALAGALMGAIISNELALVAGAACALLLRNAPHMALRVGVKRRSIEAERHLSEMLEVVALGLRSGLTFDRSFELYGSYFDSEFAASCAKALRRWSLGLTPREEALRMLAGSYDCEQLERVTAMIVRGLRFGSSLADSLENAAAQSRDSYRAVLAERVAKAPVKMMLPTGTLILPAMLLLVMGPILLELAGGF